MLVLDNSDYSSGKEKKGADQFSVLSIKYVSQKD